MTLICDNRGKKLSNYFQVDMRNIVGEGGYATVVVGKDKETGVSRAIKMIQKRMVACAERLQQEIDILVKMDHPNINKLFSSFEDDRYVYLVLELCSGGELFDRIQELGHLTEREAAIIMQQILRAVAHMHKNGIAHRDLKPENFLFLHKAPIEGNMLKVIDFGIAAHFVEGTTPFTEQTGTPYYVAPEVLSWPCAQYGKECDLWSCGVIMYVLLSGRLPFRGPDDQRTFQKVRKGKFAFPPEVFGEVSEDAKCLIRRMLVTDPAERITADQALNDKWTRCHAPSAAPAPLVGSVVQAIRTFEAGSKLKKAALHIVARQLDEGQIKQLRNIFIELDANGDGHLTGPEFAEGLRRADLGHFDLAQDLNAMFASLDTDGSGEIDYSEFLAATVDRRQYLNEAVCKAAFRVFDRNDDGLISKEELQHVLGSDSEVLHAVGKDSVHALVAEVDRDGSGDIDFEEFMQMLRR